MTFDRVRAREILTRVYRTSVPTTVLDNLEDCAHIDGVTLTREEAATTLRWKRAYDHRYGRDRAEDALDIRLGEAAS